MISSSGDHAANPKAGLEIESLLEIIRVLHIDDDENQQMFLKVFVEGDPNIKVTSAKNAEDAIQLIQTGAYDCLVTDYDMPDMNGLELAKKIRETSNIPIIIYTGRGSEEVAENAFTIGIDDYIRKETSPAHYQVVAKRIRQAVEQRRINESYRSLFDNANEAIIIHTYDGKILDVNEEACNQFGYSKNELLGKLLFEHVSSDISVEDVLTKTQMRGQIVFESANISKDGSSTPVEVSTKSIKYMGKEAILAFCRDISEKKRLEAQMKARLEALQSHAEKLSECENLGEVAKETYRILHNEMNYSFFGFGVVEEDRLRFIPNGTIDDNWDFEYPLSKPGICTTSVKTESTIIISDVRLEPDYIGPKTGYKYLSEIVVPIKVEGKVVAIINIEDKMKGKFTKNDSTLLEIFSEHIAAALLRIKLLEKTKKHLSKLEKINTHLTKLARLNEIKDVAEFTFKAIDDLIGFGDGCLGIVEDEVIKFRYVRNPNVEQIPDIQINGKGISARAVRTAASQLVSNTSLDQDFIRDIDPREYLSELDVPVKIDERVVAVINLEYPQANFFSSEDKEIVEILAGHVGATINRINLTNASLTYLSKLELISGKAEDFAKLRTERQVAELAFSIIYNLLEMDSCVIGIVEGNKLQFKYEAEPLNSIPELPLDGQGVTVKAYKTGKTQLIGDTRLDPNYVGDPEGLEYLSELSVPIKVDAKVYGVIDFGSKKLNFYNVEDGEYIELLAMYMGLAIENIRRKNKLTQLHQHAFQLAKANSYDEIAEFTLEILRAAFNFRILSFHLVNGDQVEMVANIGFDVSNRFSQDLNGPGLIPYAVRNSKSIYAPDVSREENYSRGPLVVGDIRNSEFISPVILDGLVVAIINVEDSLIDGLSYEDRVLVETFSEQVASNISRIKRINEAKDSEKALAKSEERLRNILDSFPGGVTVNVLGKFVYLNQHFADMMGYKKEELMRKTIIEVTAERDRAVVSERTRKRALGEEVPNTYEVDLMRKDDSFIHVRFFISRIEYDGEKASLTFIEDASI
jgi:PAS domain S-box-containing protein